MIKRADYIEEWPLPLVAIDATMRHAAPKRGAPFLPIIRLQF